MRSAGNTPPFFLVSTVRWHDLQNLIKNAVAFRIHPMTEAALRLILLLTTIGLSSLSKCRRTGVHGCQQENGQRCTFHGRVLGRMGHITKGSGLLGCFVALCQSLARRQGPPTCSDPPENDWPYIFTDTEHEPITEQRFAAIKQGFDRIRGRTPRR